jgi:hypothetical protein
MVADARAFELLGGSRRRVGALAALAVLGLSAPGAGCSSSHAGFTASDAGGPPPSFGNDGGAVGPDAGPVACDAISLGAGHRPLDLFIMVDRSYSMDGLPWETARTALEDFFANPPSSDLSAALNYFPNDANPTTCELQYFRLFAVGLGLLPGNAPALKASLEATQGHGDGTPSGAAIEGALFTATAQAAAAPDHRVAVVFVSDGLPNACTDEAALTAIVADALNENGTLTFTISVGTQGAAFMNSVAQAGGTGQTLYVSDPPTEIETRLRQAETVAVGCEFLVPKTAPDGRAVDPGEVNVVVTDADGKRTIGQVSGVQFCGNSDGWYYVDPTNPTALRLCPASCALLEADQAGPRPVTDASTATGAAPAVDVTFGCQSQGAR